MGTLDNARSREDIRFEIDLSGLVLPHDVA